MATTRPGNPPPEPRSIQRGPAGCGKRDKLEAVLHMALPEPVTVLSADKVRHASP